MIRARNNIIKTLFVSIVVFLMCMSFKEFLLVLQFFDAIVVNFDAWIFQVSNAMIYCTCIVDPVVYFTNYEEFQRGFCKVFCRQREGCWFRNEVGVANFEEPKVVYIKPPLIDLSNDG